MALLLGDFGAELSLRPTTSALRPGKAGVQTEEVRVASSDSRNAEPQHKDKRMQLTRAELLKFRSSFLFKDAKEFSKNVKTKTVEGIFGPALALVGVAANNAFGLSSESFEAESFEDVEKKELSFESKGALRNDKSVAVTESTSSEASPRVWRPGTAQSPLRQLEKRINGILNKVTTTTYDRLSQQVIDYALEHAKEEELLNRVAALLVEFAMRNRHFQNLYTDLAVRLSTALQPVEELIGATTPEGQPKPTFKRMLAANCQAEFCGRTASQLVAPADVDAEEREFIENKRRSLTTGLMAFVGMLFTKRVLSERIVHGAVWHILNKASPSLEDVDNVIALLQTAGELCDELNRTVVSAWFERLQQWRQMPQLKGRGTYLIWDLAELRKRFWCSDRPVMQQHKIEDVRRHVVSQVGTQDTVFEDADVVLAAGAGEAADSTASAVPLGFSRYAAADVSKASAAAPASDAAVVDYDAEVPRRFRQLSLLAPTTVKL
ncbi:MAG: hypothetical protein MHM6MM_007186 [Cercozoa sp. M6MM]